MKIRRILAAAAAMTIFVSGCGGSQVDTAEVDTLLAQAKNTMETVESMAAEMTMDISIAIVRGFC